MEAALGSGVERVPQQEWTRSEVLTVLIGRLRREVTGKGQEPRTPLIWGSTAPKSLPPFLGRSALCQDCTANGDRLESDGDTSVGYLRRGWRQMWA